VASAIHPEVLVEIGWGATEDGSAHLRVISDFKNGE
jgi:hypothetical protein